VNEDQLARVTAALGPTVEDMRHVLH